jgi:inosose dehydratase
MNLLLPRRLAGRGTINLQAVAAGGNLQPESSIAMDISRRRFLESTAATALVPAFKPPTLAAQAEFKIGYQAITWGEDVEQAMDEIAEIGFRGIQIRRPNYERYAARAAEFKDRLAAKKLQLVSISSGNITIKPENAKQEIADRVAMARWLKEVGGPYLQVIDGVRTPGYRYNPEDCRRLGKHMNEIGKRIFGEYGVRLVYHNHMNSLGERRNEIDCILEATDPKAVWVLPDIAHLHTAEADPVVFVRHYFNRIAYPHFKDVIIHQPWGKSLDGSTIRPKYDFVELGQGKVNIPGVLQIMKDYRYQGWIIIELDRAPAGRTPKESAALSKRYVEEKLKLRL